MPVAQQSVTTPWPPPVGRAPGNEVYVPRLRWYRGYPEPIPPDRSFISDAHLEPVIISGGDFGRALRPLEPPFVFVEWDMALDPQDCEAFEDFVEQAPDQLAVAPYLLWNVSSSGPMLACWEAGDGVLRLADDVAAWPQEWLPEPLRRVAEQEAALLESKVTYYQPVAPGADVCDTFGFGCIYFPREVLELAWSEGLHRELHYPNADSIFSWWARDKGLTARICWDCQPKHIHW